MNFLLCFFLSVAVKIHLTDSLEIDSSFSETKDFILKEVDPEKIAENLKYLTRQQHLAGTAAEKENAEWIEYTWKNQGLDEVHLVPYNVLLSYPDKEKANLVKIEDESENVIWTSQGKSTPLHSIEESSPEITPDFNAYSPSGNVQAEIVFANFAREEDFEKLEELGVQVTGKILIVKYGHGFRGNKVEKAAKHGAIGVLLYADPQQYAPDGMDRVYPDTWYLPGEGAAFGTVMISNGDPLTQLYPSIDSAYRIPEDEAKLPTIPVMPLGYNDAEQILSKMSGETAPSDWQGGLNTTYKLGPGLADGCLLNMEVHMELKRTTIYNVIGMLKGDVEPDRYVLLGNHRDAWIFGSVDPSGGTAALIELTRTLASYKAQGWSPRRTMVFCSWAAEEYGLIGSNEWVQQFGLQLTDRAVAYINVDMPVGGNYTLSGGATPMLFNVSREITKLVPNPDPAEVEAGRKTVYDTWLKNNPDEEDPSKPKMDLLGGGSDHETFQMVYGVPSADFYYTHSQAVFGEPLYHTIYETYYTVSELIDKGFHFSASMCQLWALLATYIADQKIVPYSVSEYAQFIEENQRKLLNETESLLKDRKNATDYFAAAAREFTEAAKNFDAQLEMTDMKSDLMVRKVNDQMMQVERSFIDRNGLPGRPDYNHVVMATSAQNAYGGLVFSGLTDALVGIENLSQVEREERWRVFDQHIAVCTFLLQTAAKTLTEELW